MPKFTFICEHDGGGWDGLAPRSKLTYETDTEGWRDLEDEFIAFLRGCTYQIPPGYEDWERQPPEPDTKKEDEPLSI